MDFYYSLDLQIKELKEITTGIDHSNLSTLYFDTFYPARLNVVGIALNDLKLYIDTTYQLNYPKDIEDIRNDIVNLISTLDDLKSSMINRDVSLIKRYNDELKKLLNIICANLL